MTFLFNKNELQLWRKLTTVSNTELQVELVTLMGNHSVKEHT